jgi:hypothetical protein
MIDEFVVNRVTWHTFHDVTLGLLVGKRYGGNEIGAEINTQDGDGTKRQRYISEDEQ